MLPLTPTQHYLAGIRLQRKIYFVTSFTISKWLKKSLFMILKDFSQRLVLKIMKIFQFDSKDKPKIFVWCKALLFW